MTIFLTTPSPPTRTRAPSPFRQNIVKQSHGGAVLCGEQPAVLGTAVSQPTSPALAARARGSRPAPAITGSHCPIPSFLAEPLTPPYLSGVGSRHRISQIILESEGHRGKQSPFRVQGRTVQGQAHWSADHSFHCSRCGSSCDQGKTEITGFGLTVCY